MSTENTTAHPESGQSLPLPEAASFPIADNRRWLSHDDIDKLLKKALMDKYADLQAHKKSYYDEWAADAPTFIKTTYQWNALNISESLAAAGVISYIGKQSNIRKAELKELISIWSNLERDRKNPDISEAAAYKKAEEKLQKKGLAFEGMENFDTNAFHPHRFLALEKKYNETSFDRTKRYLKNPLQTMRMMRMNSCNLRSTLRDGVMHFSYGLIENVRDPHKFKTPKAVVDGITATFNLAVSRVKNLRQHISTKSRELNAHKKAYINSPVTIDHWEEAINIERAVQENYSKSVPLFMAFSAATAFMALHAAEAVENVANDNYGGLAINVFSAVAGACPLKELGHDLQRKWKEVSSKRVQLAERYIRLVQDSEIIKTHETPEAGFRALVL